MRAGSSTAAADKGRELRLAKLELYGSDGFRAAWQEFEAAINDRDAAAAEEAIGSLTRAANAEAKPVEPGQRTSGLESAHRSLHNPRRG